MLWCHQGVQYYNHVNTMYAFGALGLQQFKTANLMLNSFLRKIA